MNSSDWIDAQTACALLGVRPQTLYAYVSRHKIHVQSDPKDARSSLYSRRDVDHLARQKKRPRARADVAQAAIRWGDPILPTAISEVRDGTLWLRGTAIETCAQEMTLEQVASHLCDLPAITCPPTITPITGATPFTRAMQALAQETEQAAPLQDLSPDQLAQTTGHLLSVVADACLGAPQGGPIHSRVAHRWGLDPEHHALIRQALVLLSDHELNPSTFAVRVCASTGTSLPAALLAGVATLSGDKHGGVAEMTHHAITAQMDGHFPTFLRDHPKLTAYEFGFGHPLYPEGDPRAACILRQLPENAPPVQAIRQIADHQKHPPNIDAALTALSLHLSCPRDAATTIFAIGRVAGWTAHAIEQAHSGTIIRPRATFTPNPTVRQT